MQHLLAAAEKCQASAPLGVQVAPNIPILYFGNLDDYEASDLRIVTAALNPSDAEFPLASPLSRFPNLASYRPAQPTARRLAALQSAYNAYFDVNPYIKWFGNLEHVLTGFCASYRRGAKRTALHTDLMSPVATHPTWSKLKPPVSAALSAVGVPLWHDLVEYLRPDVLLISVARVNFRRLSFPAQAATSKSIILGGKHRYRVFAHTVHLRSGKSTDVVYTTPAQVPFGFLSHVEKTQVGPMLCGQLTNW